MKTDIIANIPIRYIEVAEITKIVIPGVVDAKLIANCGPLVELGLPASSRPSCRSLAPGRLVWRSRRLARGRRRPARCPRLTVVGRRRRCPGWGPRQVAASRRLLRPSSWPRLWLRRPSPRTADTLCKNGGPFYTECRCRYGSAWPRGRWPPRGRRAGSASQ